MHIAFFSVAPHERAAIEAAPFPGATTSVFTQALDECTAACAADAEAVSVFIYSRVNEAVLERLPRLRFVVTRSTGFDHIDLAACHRRGVLVSYVPTYGEHTVAEHAFMLIFALARQLRRSQRQTQAMDFSFDGLQGFDLLGKTLGVIGAGHIGRNALRIGRGIGMEALAYDPAPDHDLAHREGFRYVGFDELLSRADVVSLHAALTPGTRHLLDRAAIARMKPGAILVNTARGAIVDSEALYEALRKGHLAGAGLDVFEGEELVKDEDRLVCTPLTADQLRQLALAHALMRLDNVIVTPHVGFFTRESVDRLVQASLDNLRGYLAGSPRNLVPGSTPARTA